MSKLLDLATAKLEEAKLFLAEVRDLDVAKELVNQAKTLEFYTRQRNDAAEAQGNAYELVQHANRALGRLLRELPKSPGGRPKKDTKTLPLDGKVSKGEALDRLDISTQDASRMEALAALADEEFARRVRAGREERSDAAAAAAGIAATTASSEHDGDSWGTPVEYIELARTVLGSIEVDPASNALAQRVVKATRFYTKETNGLEQSWKCTEGGLWLNPPYSRGLVSEFANRWVERREQYQRKSGGGGMLLVNAATETGWFQKALEHSTAVLFPSGRLGFIDPSTGEPVKNNDRSQALFYSGPKLPLFRREASKFGQVMMRA